MKYLYLLLLVFTFSSAKDIAIIKNIKGEVTAQTFTTYFPLKNGDKLQADMLIHTKKGSAVIVFNDNSTVLLGDYSIINLKNFVFNPIEDEYDFELFLLQGDMSFESGKIGELAPEKFILETPEGVVAIRGTKFFVKVRK